MPCIRPCFFLLNHSPFSDCRNANNELAALEDLATQNDIGNTHETPADSGTLTDFGSSTHSIKIDTDSEHHDEVVAEKRDAVTECGTFSAFTDSTISYGSANDTPHASNATKAPWLA